MGRGAWSTTPHRSFLASLSKQRCGGTRMMLLSMSSAAWPVDAGGQDYRHFRIFQTGQTSAGANHLMCAGIELYGRGKFDGGLWLEPLCQAESCRAS